MSKATALEEMYLIYQVMRSYLADAEPWGECGLEDLVASYRSFCQREPVGGMFLTSVLAELLERARGYPAAELARGTAALARKQPSRQSGCPRKGPLWDNPP